MNYNRASKYIYPFIILLFLSDLALSQNNSNFGIIITDLSANNVVYEQNSNKQYLPASITKMITTATALEILGDNHVFTTKVEIDGYISQDTLVGDVIIRAGGDPTLHSKFFSEKDFLNQCVESIKKCDIKHITGDIIADNSIFDTIPIPEGWNDKDIGNYYAAGVYGLSFYDNTVSVKFNSLKSGTRPQIIGLYPNVKNMKIDNELISRVGVGDNAYFSGKPFDNNRSITGSIEANRREFVVKADMGNPPLVLLEALKDSLKKQGINLHGKIVCSNTKVQQSTISTTILEYSSPALIDIIGITNVRSNNMFAEHILKHISRIKSPTGSTKKGIEIVKNFYEKRGIDISTLDIYDGSGLSDLNKFTPKNLSDILNYIYQYGKYYNNFLESLPIAGKNGTVKRLFKNTPLEGKAHVKSGSKSNIQSYAGYITNKGKTYSFVIINNDFKGSRRKVIKTMEKILIKHTS